MAVCKQNQLRLDAIGDDADRAGRLAELNVEWGVHTLRSCLVVEEAVRERRLEVHGVLYDVACGKLRDLGVGNGAQERTRTGGIESEAWDVGVGYGGSDLDI